MSKRDRQRHQAADDAAREHGEEQVELLIAAAIGLIVYLLGTWTAAVWGGVVWLGTAVVMRMYAVRLRHRQGRGTRPSG